MKRAHCIFGKAMPRQPDSDPVSQKYSEQALGQEGDERSWPLKDPIGAPFP